MANIIFEEMQIKKRERNRVYMFRNMLIEFISMFLITCNYE